MDSFQDRFSYLHSRQPSVDRRARPAPSNMKPTVLYEDRILEVDESTDEDETGSLQSDCDYDVGVAVGAGDASTTAAAVYLRLRSTPQSYYKIEENVLKERNTKLAHSKERHFTFSKIFAENESQSIIYDRCVFDAIDKEENLSVLTYGVSGSGKTFTILGDVENAGLIPRAINHIFCRYDGHVCEQAGVKIQNGQSVILDDDQVYAEVKKRSNIFKICGASGASTMLGYIEREHNFQPCNGNGTVFIYVSYVEIYNEIITDLLSETVEENKENFGGAPVQRKQLKIMTNQGNVFIKDLTSVFVKSGSEALKLLTLGKTRIKFASTALNKNSSRSHCIFFIDIIKHSDHDNFNHFTYKFCDLAGAERLKKTENVGNRLKEAQRINSSLLALGRCLDAVHINQQKKSKRQAIPFRDSKLTTLLQAPLSGKEKMSIIVSMMPTIEYAEENLNVLNFASIARQIVQCQRKRKESPRSVRYSWYRTHINCSSPNNRTDDSRLFEENYR